MALRKVHLSLAVVLACSVGGSRATSDWIPAGEPEGVVSWTVALPIRDGAIEKVTALLNNVSDPNSQQYGQYLSPWELRKLTATSPLLVKAMVEAFKPAVCYNMAGSALRCTANVDDAESVLGTKLSTYVHRKTGATAVRVAKGASIKVPASVAEHVVFISGINQLLDLGSRRSSPPPTASSASSSSNDLWTSSSNDGAASSSSSSSISKGDARNTNRHGSNAASSSSLSSSSTTAATTTTTTTTTTVPEGTSSQHSREYHLQKCPKNGKRHTECIGAQTMVALETIRKMYNVTIRGSPLIAQAAAEFHGNFHVDTDDLSAFGKLNGLGLLEPLKVGRHEGVPDPGPNPANTDDEVALDIQYLAGVGLSNSNWILNSEHWIFELTQLIQNATLRPSVVSMSYAWSEEVQCGTTADGDCSIMHLNSAQYVNRTNFELQKVALLGITMVAASGDSGAHGRTDESCLFNPKTHPAYPAASPFVLSVGGTQFNFDDAIQTEPAETPICRKGGELANNCALSGTEIVASTKTMAKITSGGGFSEIAPRPSYQDAVVAAYLTNREVHKNVKAKNYNGGGRGYPDISALAHNFFIRFQNKSVAQDGTSASSPVIAGIVGLINAHRKRNNRPTVGLFNPLLYQIYDETKGAAFHDIWMGNNICTESGCICESGFPAVHGWDAASGLGTPNVGLMLDAIDAIDARREANGKHNSTTTMPPEV